MNYKDSLEPSTYITYDRIFIKYNSSINIITLETEPINSKIDNIECNHTFYNDNFDEEVELNEKQEECCNLAKYNSDQTCKDLKENKMDLSNITFEVNQEDQDKRLYIIETILLQFPDLTEINFSNLKLGTDINMIYTMVNNFFVIPNIEILNLSNNNINDESAKHIFENLSHFPNLKTLILKNNCITDEAINDESKGLYNVLNNNSSIIEKINLQNNCITTEGATIFIIGFDLPNLNYINLQWNKIRSDDFELKNAVDERKKHIVIDI